MPPTTKRDWYEHVMYCPICPTADPDEKTVLRCAVSLLLEHGSYMIFDDIPFDDVLTAGGDYLRRMSTSPSGSITPAPDEKLWALLEAEVRLALARATGLRPTSTLDPRIDDILADVAQWPEKRQMLLFEKAHAQFIGAMTSPR